jgi:hypothetical protein
MNNIERERQITQDAKNTFESNSKKKDKPKSWVMIQLQVQGEAQNKHPTTRSM